LIGRENSASIVALERNSDNKGVMINSRSLYFESVPGEFRGASLPASYAPRQYPCFSLTQSDWDDFGHTSTFALHYFSSISNRTRIGDLKILRNGSLRTGLPIAFSDLGRDYCSLGQSIEYYQKLNELFGESDSKTILSALQDAICNNRTDVRTWTGFESSLIRNSEPRFLLETGKRVLEKGVLPGRGGFTFTFSVQLSGFAKAHSIYFDFDPHGGLPNRVFVLVGKNGTGKSGVVASLAKTLSGLEATVPSGQFDGRPLMSRTICMSYSIFQAFAPPVLDTSSYRYCGLLRSIHGRALEGKLVGAAWKDELQLRLSTMADGSLPRHEERYAIWKKLVGRRDIMGDVALGSFADISHHLDKLSTGQLLMVSYCTDLAQHLETDSLVLLDEPENTLHPTLISSFMRLLHEALDAFQSYAVVSTHSPIVVQEMPSRHLRILRRTGNTPSVSSLGIETLGANLTETVERIFEMNDDDKNYLRVISDLLSKNSNNVQEAEQQLEKPLSVNTRALLRAIAEGRAGK
jgi:predicted ATPase